MGPSHSTGNLVTRNGHVRRLTCRAGVEMVWSVRCDRGLLWGGSAKIAWNEAFQKNSRLEAGRSSFSGPPVPLFLDPRSAGIANLVCVSFQCDLLLKSEVGRSLPLFQWQKQSTRRSGRVLDARHRRGTRRARHNTHPTCSMGYMRASVTFRIPGLSIPSRPGPLRASNAQRELSRPKTTGQKTSFWKFIMLSRRNRVNINVQLSSAKVKPPNNNPFHTSFSSRGRSPPKSFASRSTGFGPVEAASGCFSSPSRRL